ncbi:MAG: sigma-54 dependent transcriptional regulator [Pirellulales bacterium]
MNAVMPNVEVITGQVLVVDDHRDARESLADILRHGGHRVDCCSSAVEALAAMDRQSYDLVITDMNMPGMNGLEFIRRLEQRPHGAQVLMVTAYASVASAVEAIRHGAFDYIEKPYRVEQIESLVQRALAHGQMLDGGQPMAPAVRGSADASANAMMIGDSEPMRALRARIAQIAATDETVLVVGESGTGKELVARAVHAASSRADRPLVSLNCPVLSAQLMESELFGHERGAFTGADAPRTGRFELAHQGTILLDEVTEIELPLQAKLLRVLQEREFEKVGSSRTIQVDVRVIATTNRDLRHEIADGNFREDLYFRLAVVPLHLAPLRERRDDIPALVEAFQRRAAERLGREAGTLANCAAQLLQEYHWPGNIRELQNLVTRANVLNTTGTITADELRPWLLEQDYLDQPDHGGAELPIGVSLHEMERKLIEATLDHFGGHRAKTAEALGIGLRTLSGKLKSYGYAPRTKSFSKAA